MKNVLVFLALALALATAGVAIASNVGPFGWDDNGTYISGYPIIGTVVPGTTVPNYVNELGVTSTHNLCISTGTVASSWVLVNAITSVCD